MITSAAIRDINSTIYTGRRHHEIFLIMPREMIKNCKQGFVTDTDDFVSREKAADIAFCCGQIKQPKKTLFSEDLW